MIELMSAFLLWHFDAPWGWWVGYWGMIIMELIGVVVHVINERNT